MTVTCGVSTKGSRLRRLRVPVLPALLALFLAGVASAAELSWPALLQPPELWPTQCVLRKSRQFQSGPSVKAGQTVDILEMHPNEIVVAAGQMSFAVQPTDTDALAVANAAYAKLTPAQRGLTYAVVLQHPEWWPWKLTVKDTFDLGRGRRITKGDTVYLMAVENGALEVCPAQFDTHFELQPADTDILAYARQYVGQAGGAPGRLVQELEGKLINAASGAPAPLKADAIPKYFVVYHAARWCPYTQRFTPTLLKFYQEMKPNHPEFEVIYMPAEKSAAELRLYAQEVHFPWPAVDFAKKDQVAVLAWVLGHSGTPELGVFDRYGNTIIDPAKVDRDLALKQFAALLNRSAGPE